MAHERTILVSAGLVPLRVSSVARPRARSGPRARRARHGTGLVHAAPRFGEDDALRFGEDDPAWLRRPRGGGGLPGCPAGDRRAGPMSRRRPRDARSGHARATAHPARVARNRLGELEPECERLPGTSTWAAERRRAGNGGRAGRDAARGSEGERAATRRRAGGRGGSARVAWGASGGPAGCGDGGACRRRRRGPRSRRRPRRRAPPGARRPP